MGQCREHQPPVMLFIAIMATRMDWIEEAIGLLGNQFGPIIAQATPYDFDQFTLYYAPEFGTGLRKTIIALNNLILPENLISIKRQTNEWEAGYQPQGAPTPEFPLRRINLDPGYLSLSKVVLATTKDHAHRIYMGQGIFEEITLIYRKKEGFRPNPWTYPDYRAQDRLDFFNGLRQQYLAMLRFDDTAQKEKSAAS